MGVITTYKGRVHTRLCYDEATPQPQSSVSRPQTPRQRGDVTMQHTGSGGQLRGLGFLYFDIISYE